MELRRSRFIRPDLQIRFILLPLSIAVGALLLDLYLSLRTLERESAPAITVPSVLPVLEGMRSSLLLHFLVSLAAAALLSIALGILLSFPFAGPCHRIRRYFLDLITGPWDRRFVIRKRDKLRDVAEAIDEGLEGFRSFLVRHQEALAEADRLLAREMLEAVEDPARKKDVREVRDRIKALLAEHASRFPGRARTRSPAPAPGREGSLTREAARQER